jgi:hypothetical protein
MVFSWLSRPLRRRDRTPRRGTVHPRSYRPQLECLEARQLLAQMTYWVTNTDDAGAGSFRQAILDANKHTNDPAGRDIIRFKIGKPGEGKERTIKLMTALDPITDPVIINGTPPQGYEKQVIVLDGGNIKAGASGLIIVSGKTTVRNLVINSFLSDPNARNLLDQKGNGIELRQGGGNVIQGCYIGTDKTGTVAKPNATSAILIVDSAGNQIGGENRAVPEGNILSGNRNGTGVFIDGTKARKNRVEGNFIGTNNVAGKMDDVPNNFGVIIDDAPDNTIGEIRGPSSPSNVISGNAVYGVEILGENATGNHVENNFIGLDYSGKVAVSNSKGVFILGGANNNVIGGTTSSRRNVISGNEEAGIYIDGMDTIRNRVEGNYIGTTADGKTAVPNRNGITLDDTQLNQIGGASPRPGAAPGNVISGSKATVLPGEPPEFLGGFGILIKACLGNTVVGNLVGTNADGTAALPNVTGVELENSQGSIIGDPAPGKGNVLSGNKEYGLAIVGIIVDGELPPAAKHSVRGNLIGTDATGLKALPNQAAGVKIDDAEQNTIGGPQAGAGNVIAGNGLSGIVIVGTNDAFHNKVLNNIIGANKNGAALRNGGWGVYIGQGARRNTIRKNDIKFNELDAIKDENPRDPKSKVAPNTFTANSISGNGGLGIDIGPAGPTPDGAPVLTSAVLVGGNVVIQGTLLSAPDTTFVLEFFTNSAPDPSGYAQGENYLGSITVTTDSNGYVSFATPSFSTQGLAVGNVTATATDPDVGTSEFSADLPVGLPTLTPVATRDDREWAFGVQGAWQLGNEGWLGGDHWHAAGTGSDTATWVLALPPGAYQLYATWVASAANASAATYTIFDGITVLGTVTQSQQRAPGDGIYDQFTWASLGVFATQSGYLTIQLSGNADGVVIADGVLAVQAAAPAAAPVSPLLWLAAALAPATAGGVGRTPAPTALVLPGLAAVGAGDGATAWVSLPGSHDRAGGTPLLAGQRRLPPAAVDAAFGTWDGSGPSEADGRWLSV